MADDNKLIVEIELDDGSIKKGFLKIQKESKNTSNQLSEDFGKVGKGILSIGAAFTAIFTAIFAGVQTVKRAINNLKEFQTSLAEVNTITKLTSLEQENLKNKLIDLSAQFGTSAKDQAKSYYQIISAGITDTAQANQLLIDSNKLAIGGLTSTASSIDILTTAVNSFKSTNLSSTRAADILFGTVKLGKTTVSELSASLGQVLTSSSALGVRFEDVGAALATLTTRGVSTSEAVTQLNAVFTAILKQQETAAKMGKEVANAFTLQALKTKGLTNFLKDLNTALGGSEEKLVKLLGRAEGARAIITLAGDKFKTLSYNVKELDNSSGSADEAFKKIDETIDQKLNKSLSKFDGLILKISTNIEGPLGKALDLLNLGLDTASVFFDRFSEGTKGELARTKLDIENTTEALKALKGETSLSTKALNALVFSLTGVNIANQDSSKTAQQLENRLEFLSQKRDKLATSIQAEADAQSRLNDLKNQEPEEPTIEPLSVFDGFSETLTGANEQLNEFTIKAKENFNAAGKSAINGLGKGVGNAFAAFGGALAKGENALEAFGKAFLAAVGQTAISLGTNFILTGAAYAFSGNAKLEAQAAPLISAGAALAAFGGALSAINGGTTSPNTSTSSSSDSNFSTDQNLVEVPEPQPSNQINVNVNGDIFDSNDTGLRIAKLLQDELDKSGTSILQVT